MASLSFASTTRGTFTGPAGARSARSPCQLSRRTCPTAGPVQAVADPDSLLPDRRAALGLLTGVAALTLAPHDARAAYGEPANVFGKTTSTKGYVTYAGDGFSVSLPSKWVPSAEKEFPGTVLRYVDNMFPANSFSVLKQEPDGGKREITDYGSPEEFLNTHRYLFGRQNFSGETVSEGGFEPDRVASASLLEANVTKDSKGKKYYNLDVLSRTADGTEGGHRQIIVASVGSDGSLYMLKTKAGDKRWIRDTKNVLMGTIDSFTVA